MSTEAKTTLNNAAEVIEVKGSQLIETVQEISANENFSRLIIYNEKGDRLLDIPYAAGVTVTVLVTIFMPTVALLTPFVLLLGRFKIEIIRPEAQQSASASEEPAAPAEETQPEATEEAEATSSESESEVESEEATPSEEPEPDDLERIRGIGKVFAGRLHDAGIHTFAQVAEQTPEELMKIVSPDKTEQMFDVTPWIAQARELSQENS